MPYGNREKVRKKKRLDLGPVPEPPSKEDLDLFFDTSDEIDRDLGPAPEPPSMSDFKDFYAEQNQRELLTSKSIGEVHDDSNTEDKNLVSEVEGEKHKSGQLQNHENSFTNDAKTAVLEEESIELKSENKRKEEFAEKEVMPEKSVSQVSHSSKDVSLNKMGSFSRKVLKASQNLSAIFQPMEISTDSKRISGSTVVDKQSTFSTSLKYLSEGEVAILNNECSEDFKEAPKDPIMPQNSEEHRRGFEWMKQESDKESIKDDLEDGVSVDDWIDYIDSVEDGDEEDLVVHPRHPLIVNLIESMSQKIRKFFGTNKEPEKSPQDAGETGAVPKRKQLFSFFSKKRQRIAGKSCEEESEEDADEKGDGDKEDGDEIQDQSLPLEQECGLCELREETPSSKERCVLTSEESKILELRNSSKIKSVCGSHYRSDVRKEKHKQKKCSNPMNKNKHNVQSRLKGLQFETVKELAR